MTIVSATRRRTCAALVAVAAAAWGWSSSAPQATETPAQGRTLTLVSGWTPDGGDSQQERMFAGMTISGPLSAMPQGGRAAAPYLVARHLSRHLAGAPAVAVKILPGSGGRRAARYLHDDAPRDGSVIGYLERGLIAETLLLGAATPAVIPSSLRYGWLGAFAPDVGLLIVRSDAGIAAADDLRRTAVIVAGTVAVDESVRLAHGLNGLLGTQLRVVAGYGGLRQVHYAIERGEASGFVAGGWDDAKDVLVPWLAAGTAFAALQLGPQPARWLPDVPLATELARNADERAALDLLFASQRLGLAFVAPPDLPAAQLAGLRVAFAAMAADADFRAAAARIGIDALALSADDVAALVRDIAQAPADLRARVGAAMRGAP